MGDKHHYSRRGFTIVEVMLFLAISGFLIVGLMVGTGAMIARQRYNDSVQDFAEFFRRQYSAVINPENPNANDRIPCIDDFASRPDPFIFEGGGNFSLSVDYIKSLYNSSGDFNMTPWEEGKPRGRSNCVVYGRAISFVQDGDRVQDITSTALVGLDLPAIKSSIKEYGAEYSISNLPPELTAVIDYPEDQNLRILSLADITFGKAYANISWGGDGAGSAPSVDSLSGPGDPTSQARCKVGVSLTPALEEYPLQWSARAEQTGPSDAPRTGTILIFRSPTNGVIQTFYSQDAQLGGLNTVIQDGHKLSDFLGGTYNIATGGFDSNGACNGNSSKGVEALDAINAELSDVSSQIATGGFSHDGDLDPETGEPTHRVHICVGSDDLLAIERRRMITIDVASGRNASSVEIIQQDNEANTCDNS